MLQRLYHLLLGAIAGLIVGIIPAFIAGVLSDNGVFAAGVLTSCILVGAILGVMQYEKINIFFDGLFELITIW